MRILFALIPVLLSSHLFASGLTIHATEAGIGKFHRYDTGVHPYESTNAWMPYILPAGAGAVLPLIQENSAESVTVFFDTLENLLKQIVKISQERGQKISVLNINAHGLPGAMWFPSTENFMNSFECYSWKAAAQGSDEKNYKQYYTAVSKDDILDLRDYSNTGGYVSCVTQAVHWKSVVNSIPEIRNVWEGNARVNLLSCLVGLGPVGEKFTKELAGILFTKQNGEVHSSLAFGLGDWSMPEGMGFWDYQTDEQLSHDNGIYPVNKRDRDIMQKGSIRVGTAINGNVNSTVIADVPFMLLDNSPIKGTAIIETKVLLPRKKPASIRIPGTDVRLFVK